MRNRTVVDDWCSGRARGGHLGLYKVMRVPAIFKHAEYAIPFPRNPVNGRNAPHPAEDTPQDLRKSTNVIPGSTGNLPKISTLFRSLLQRVVPRPRRSPGRRPEHASRRLWTDSNPDTGNKDLRGLILPASTQERSGLSCIPPGLLISTTIGNLHNGPEEMV